MDAHDRSGYQKLRLSTFQTTNGKRLLGRVAKHIRQQAEDPPFVSNTRLLSAMPDEVQTIFWLWLFICEAEGGGIEVFLLQHLGFYTPQVAAALKAVEAQELLRRLLAGVPLALGSGTAEFSRAPNLTWFKSLPADKDFPTLQSVDRGAYPSLYVDLRERCRRFIIQHVEVFFE